MATFCPSHHDIPSDDSDIPYSKPKIKGNQKKKKEQSVPRSISRPKDILSCYKTFPPFSDLPPDYEICQTYYEMDRRGDFVPSCTWCFLGEIINDEFAQIPFLRHRAIVKDRRGQELPIFFYPEQGIFDYSTIKIGRTISVFFGEFHHFLDLQIGLRVEDLNTVKVIKCRLNELFALSKHYAKCCDNCWGCGYIPVDSSTLKKCSACKVALYCDKSCQLKDWKERHKRWCKAMPEFLHLASIDYRQYSPNALWKK